MIIAVALASVIIFTEQKNMNNIDNEANLIETREYDLGISDFKIEVPEDMYILSESEINYYFGENYASAYDCIAVSQDFQRIIMAFTDEKGDKSAEDYLKEAISSNDTEIKEEKIKGNTFYTVEFTYEDDDNTYITKNCVYDAGDKFVCIVLDSLESNQISLKDVIK